MSLTTTADFSSHPLPTSPGISYTSDDIADKLAADANFVELIDLFISTEIKIRTLSIEEKILFKKYVHEGNNYELSNLFTKSGIDYKGVFSQKRAILTSLNKKYNLSNRSDKKEIINKAIEKNKIPFAVCIGELTIGSLACDALEGGSPEYHSCVFAVFAAWIACTMILD